MAIPSGRGGRNQPDIILFTETKRAYSIGRLLGTLLFSAKDTIYKAAYPSSRRWILSRRANHSQGATRERLFVVEHQGIEWDDVGANRAARVYSTCSFKQSLISKKWVPVFRKDHAPSIS
jgi:4'-phosphopantetheinyl transferase EntD